MQHTVNWGILGCARIARMAAIPALRRTPGAQVWAIASRDAEKLAACQQEFAIPTGHVSYEALLADPAIDAVYIPLPNALHKEWRIPLLLVTHDLDEARRIGDRILFLEQGRIIDSQ